MVNVVNFAIAKFLLVVTGWLSYIINMEAYIKSLFYGSLQNVIDGEVT